LSRNPKIETFATPSTPIRPGRIVQRASTDCWIGLRWFDESPMIITRLSEETGWSIWGGAETLGFACA
jgi:hypothetical protein